MSEINKNAKAKMNGTVSGAEQDYQENFMPKVHIIGRATMALAFIISFLPVMYFVFIKGDGLPFSSYANVMLAIGSIGIGLWLTEPLAFWPVLGSAGTYIAYLSGNVGGMRFPVALSVQSASKSDINTPKGQVLTIVGIVASVFCNLIILLIVVLSGSWIMSKLPESVLAAFAYVMPCLYGCMMLMILSRNKDGVVKAAINNSPYLGTAIICKIVISNWLPQLATYGTAISVGLTILVAYILFKRKTSKAVQ